MTWRGAVELDLSQAWGRSVPYQRQDERETMTTDKVEPILFIFTGPSGAGKGSVMRALLRDDPTLRKVVTYTTRSPREGEVDGFDYRFVSVQQFLQLVEQGKIFEYENVYRDHYYGSPRELFVPGNDGIIELDYKGRIKYQERWRQVISIFLMPPSLDELKKRILSRSHVANLSARLDNAVEQLRHAKSYDYVVKNDDLDQCVARVADIVRVERLRRDGRYQLDEMIHELQDER